MKLTKLKTALAATTLALAATTAFAADMRIAYTGYSTDNTFWIGVATAAAAEAEKQGVEFIDMTASSPDSAAQKDAVDRAIDMGVDGIIIGSVDNRAFAGRGGGQGHPGGRGGHRHRP